jgi:ElaB/YqjD/DUF883 family membrane-anchored ribosome-binding protein
MLSITKSGNPMKSRLLTVSLLAMALFAGLGLAPAMAQGTNTPGIDQMEQAISARIQQGVASGHITPSEARELYRADRDIQMRENRMKSDGVATAQERQQLRADLEALGAEVERMMANGDVVGQGDGNTPGIDERQADISQRIDEGVRSGQISRREARRLQVRERNIARHEASFKRDGVVTRQERRQLRDELAQLSDAVERVMSRDSRDSPRRY